MRSRYRLAAALVLGLGALAPIARAHASACCLSATTGAVGRLKVWEDYALQLDTSFAASLGDWGADGQWRAYRDSFRDHEWRTRVSGLVRVSRRVQIDASVPWVQTARSAGGLRETAGGLGDLSAGARYELMVPGDAAALTSLALTASVTAPTGRTADHSRTLLGVDATGRGAWAFAAGAVLEQVREPWFAQLTVAATLPLPAFRADIGAWQRYGPGLQTAVASGWELVPDRLVASASLHLRWEAPLSIAGALVAGSTHLESGAGLQLAWSPALRWTLVGGIDAAPAADGFGLNQPGRVVYSVGVRFGGF